MAWSSSLTPKLTVLADKEQKVPKKRNDSFYNDFKARQEENQKSYEERNPVYKNMPSSAKNNSKTTSSKTSASNTSSSTENNANSFYESYLKRKQSGKVFTPSNTYRLPNVMTDRNPSLTKVNALETDKKDSDTAFSGLSNDLTEKMGVLLTEYEKIRDNAKTGVEFNNSVSKLISDNRDVFDEYERQSGSRLSVPRLIKIFDDEAKKQDGKLNTTTQLPNISNQDVADEKTLQGVYHPNTRITSGDDAVAIEKPGFGEWLGRNVMAGVGQFNRGLASTLDFILPTAGDFGGESVIDNVIDYYKGDADKLEQNAAEVNTIKGENWETAGNLVSGTVAAIPNAVVAMMTGGTSTASNALSTSSSGLSGTLTASAQKLANSPNFWLSFAQTAGPSYDSAKENGANDIEATATAMISSLINAGVEVGGGIETIPNNPQSIYTWVKGALEEGKEEVVQGVVEGAVNKAVYDHDKTTISTEDENAVINPNRAVDEFVGGAVIGGVLGVGQIAAGKAINDYNKTVDTGKLFTDTGKDAVQSVIDEGLESDKSTSANKYAQKLTKKQDSGKEPSAWNVGRQYLKNVKAIDNENSLISSLENNTGVRTDVYDELYSPSGQEINGRFVPNTGKIKTSIRESADGQKNVKKTAYSEQLSALLSDTAVESKVGGFSNNSILENGEKVNNPQEKFTPRGNVEISSRGDTSIPETAGHEFTHAFKQYAPEEYKVYENFVIDALSKTNNEAFENRVNELEKKYGYSRDVAIEEIASEVSENFLGSKKSVDSIVQNNPSMAQKTVDIIKTAKTKIKDMIKSPYSNRTGLEATYSQLSTAEKLWNDALRKMYGDKTKSSGANSEDIKYSQKGSESEGNITENIYDYTKTFEEQIDDWKKGKIPKYDTLIVRDTPEILKKIGFNSLPVTINQTHIDYAINGTKDIDHNLGEELLKQLPQKMDEPVAIINSKTQKGTSVVALLDVVHNGNSVIVPVVIDGTGRTNDIVIDSNAITSIYGKNNAVTGLLNDAIETEISGGMGVYYIDTKKATVLLQKAGLQLPSVLFRNNGYIHSIREEKSNVKPKFENNTYSQQFKRWFGDWENSPHTASKVVNEDGSPKIVYHGTDSSFTVFDQSKYNSNEANGDYVGEGFFFASKPMAARKYGKNIMPSYLNIKNPIVINTEDDAKKFRNQFLGMFKDGEQELRELIGGDYDYFEIMENNPSTIREYLQEKGYDGLIDNLYGQYAVFSPNQIKSATDNIGTFDGNNPDIRYSVKESVFSSKQIAKDLIQKNNSDVKANDVRGDIENIHSLIKNGMENGVPTEETLEAAWNKAEDVARVIANGITLKTDYTAEMYRDLRNYIKNTPISIPNTNKSDLSGDGFNDFRKRNFGNLTITNKGIPIDSFYNELSQMYPQYFDSQREVNPAEQISKIAEVIEELKPTERSISNEDYNGYVADIASEIFNSCVNDLVKDNSSLNNIKGTLSKLYQNTMQKDAYTDEFKSEAERRKPEFMYEGITNKETYEKAQRYIIENGEEKTFNDILNSESWSADDVGKVLALVAKYQTEGDVKKAVDVYSVAREKATQAGQATQAWKIANKLTPAGQFIDFVRQSDRMIESQIEKHPAKDKVRRELEEAKKKDRTKKRKSDSKSSQGEESQRINIPEDNTPPHLDEVTENGEQISINGTEKSEVDKVLDKYKIEHLSSEDIEQVNEALKTLDSLNDKNDLIDFILKQSKERKTASHALVKKALEGQKIEFLKETAIMQLFGKITDKMPVSLGRKISTYQAMSHLLNARTMGRNIVSNTVFNTVDRTANNMGAIVDSLIGLFSKQRSVGVDKGVFEKGRFRASKDRAAKKYIDIALAVDHTDGDSKYDLSSSRRTFKGRIAGGLERGMSYGLQATDEWSKGGIEYNIRKSLERLKNSGFSEEEIKQIAEYEARYRTFQDDTKLSQVLAGLKDTLNVIGVGETKQTGRLKTHEFGLGDLVQKYTQVPGALITRSVEYSPLGYCKAIYHIGQAVYNKSKGADFSPQSQRNIALSLGRAMTGTGLIALFSMLSGLGVLTGEREDLDEKEKAFENSEGISNTQLNLSALSRFIASGGKDTGGRQNGDVLTTLGFLEPLNTLMAMGEAVSGNVKNENPIEWTNVAASKTFDQILDMSTMSTIKGVFDTLQYGGSGTDVAIGIIADSASGFIPSPIRQLGTLTDTTQRNPYNEKDDFTTAKERFKATLPVIREDVAAKITPFGDEKTTSSGNKVIDFLNSFFNPGSVSIYQSNEISQELKKLTDITTDVLPRVPAKSFSVDGVSYKPKGEDYEVFSRIVGKVTAQSMTDIIHSADYTGMTDSEKAEAFSNAAKESESTAKQLYAQYKKTGQMPDLTVTVPTEEEIQEQSQKNKVIDTLQNVADGVKNAVPDKSDGYSVTALQINEVRSVKIDDVSYKVPDEVERKIIDTATEEHFSNIEKLMNNEINVEDVVGYTQKGKARTTTQADGVKVQLTGKMYNDDGTPRFDELAIARIIYQSKERAKENAVNIYKDEIIGEGASEDAASDTTEQVSQSKGFTPNTSRQTASTNTRSSFVPRSSGGGTKSGSSSAGGSASNTSGGGEVKFTANNNLDVLLPSFIPRSSGTSLPSTVKMASSNRFSPKLPSAVDALTMKG